MQRCPDESNLRRRTRGPASHSRLSRSPSNCDGRGVAEIPTRQPKVHRTAFGGTSASGPPPPARPTASFPRSDARPLTNQTGINPMLPAMASEPTITGVPSTRVGNLTYSRERFKTLRWRVGFFSRARAGAVPARRAQVNVRYILWQVRNPHNNRLISHLRRLTKTGPGDATANRRDARWYQKSAASRAFFPDSRWRRIACAARAVAAAC